MRLRRDICLGTVEGLPPTSPGFGRSLADRLETIRAAGFEGVVAWDHWDAIHSTGLIPIGMARVLEPGDVQAIAGRHRDAGLEFTTLHVGTGFESDAVMDRLAEAIISASVKTGHALHVETHRATMTQDIYRTLQLASRHPDLRFTLDFSHWYTGHEMTYGGEFQDRLAQLTPLFPAVQSLQVRVGDTGRIQRAFDPSAACLSDHMAALSACVTTLRQSQTAPDTLSIAPELLGAKMPDGDQDRWICYAEHPEDSDRFRDALALSELIDARLQEGPRP